MLPSRWRKCRQWNSSAMWNDQQLLDVLRYVYPHLRSNNEWVIWRSSNIRYYILHYSVLLDSSRHFSILWITSAYTGHQQTRVLVRIFACQTDYEPGLGARLNSGGERIKPRLNFVPFVGRGTYGGAGHGDIWSCLDCEEEGVGTSGR